MGNSTIKSFEPVSNKSANRERIKTTGTCSRYGGIHFAQNLPWTNASLELSNQSKTMLNKAENQAFIHDDRKKWLSHTYLPTYTAGFM